MERILESFSFVAKQVIMRIIILCAIIALSSSAAVGQTTNTQPQQPGKAKNITEWFSYTDTVSGLSVKYPPSWRLKTNNPKAPIVLHAPSEGDDDRFSENINYIVRKLPAGQPINVQDIATSITNNLNNQIDEFVLLSEKNLTWFGSPAIEVLYTGTSKGEKAGVKVKILQRIAITKGYMVLATYTAQKGKPDVSFDDAVKIIDQTTFEPKE